MYKIFTAPGHIAGPSCVRRGEQITFSVPPVISTASQIGTGIGNDTYQWFINGQPITTTTWWSGGDDVYTSGDGSAITLIAPDNISGTQVLSVAIGRCNAAQLSLTLNAKDMAFTFTDFGCALYRVNAPGFVRTGATYQWFLDGELAGVTTGVSNSFVFDPWDGQKTISVRITKEDCLDATVTLANQSYSCDMLAAAKTSSVSDADVVTAYPNPAASQVTLTLPKDESVKQIQLEDQYGKVRKRFNTVESTLTVDVSTLPQGLYVITIKTGTQTVTRKLKLER